MDKYIYLDNNATTQMAPEVKQIMRENEDLYGNASSMHAMGRMAESAIAWARGEVKSLIGASAEDEVYFISGSTEGNNTVFNTFRDLIDDGSRKDRILLSTVEHPASIETAKYLKKKGYKIDYIPVDRIGMVDLKALEELMGDDVVLVSVMLDVHTDATQAIGKIEVDVKDLDVDYLTLSAHKFYGPKGVGALYMRHGVPRTPLLHGGHQEGGERAGTYNTQGIIGLGKAAELARLSVKEEREYLWKLRCALKKGIEERIDGVTFNGSDDYETALPGTLDVSFSSAEGESILLYLDLEGIEVSTGSACASGSLEPSYVLLATGLDIELAHGSIRFSFGRYNTMEEVGIVLEKLPPIIKKIREMSTRKV